MKKNLILAILTAFITGCNAGSGEQAKPLNTIYPQTINQPESQTVHLATQNNSFPLQQIPVYIRTTILNNSSQNIAITVPDSDLLNCQFNILASSINNCGASSGGENSPPVLNGQIINAGSSLAFDILMSFNGGISQKTQQTISLSVYGNNSPLFGVWEDGNGTPKPQNHYSNNYVSNILEVQNWDSQNENNSSLFVGVGNAGGLIEVPTYTVNPDGNINLIITISDTQPYTRSQNSTLGDSLCSIATPDCPSILNTSAPSNIVSVDGTYQLDMQSDGNLVLYNVEKKAVWASGTSGSGNWLALQTDGNLVIYSSTNQALWASNTVNSGATKLTVGDDGKLTLSSLNGTVYGNIN